MDSTTLFEGCNLYDISFVKSSKCLIRHSTNTGNHYDELLTISNHTENLKLTQIILKLLTVTEPTLSNLKEIHSDSEKALITIIMRVLVFGGGKKKQSSLRH